jgi:hypothetical protein
MNEQDIQLSGSAGILEEKGGTYIWKLLKKLQTCS